MPQGTKRKAKEAVQEDGEYRVDWRKEERRPFRRGFIPYGPCAVPQAAAAAKRRKLGIDSVEDPAGDDATPLPLASFEEAGAVPGWLLDGLQEAGRFAPSPIEAQALPIVLAGQNLVVVSAAGASKDAAGGAGAAYLVPAAVHAEDQAELEEEEPGPIVLVLAAQEACARVAKEASSLLEHSSSGRHAGGLRVVDVSGGGARSEKLKQLGPSGAHVVVGTPRRVHDMACKGQLSLLRVTLLALDGADRLIDRATLAEVRELSGWIRPERQTVLVSATWPRQLHQLAGDLCYAAGLPVRISVSGVRTAKPPRAGAGGAAKAAKAVVPAEGAEPEYEEVELDDGVVEQPGRGAAAGAEEEDFPDDWEAALA